MQALRPEVQGDDCLPVKGGGFSLRDLPEQGFRVQGSG